MNMPLSAHATRHPVKSLIAFFVLWKALLLFIACCSPGQGYDTSTNLILPPYGTEKFNAFPLPLQLIAAKVTRWDAIYFVRASNRGYTFEQEWAFGWGFTRLIAFCTAGLEKAGLLRTDQLQALLATLIAHISHLISVILLFNLTRAMFPGSNAGFTFVAAALHIVSPAGMFLSAPYAESSCAMLSFAGCLVFTKSFASTAQTTVKHDLLIVISGVIFGIASTFRSNGILSGLLLLEEAFRVLLSLRHGIQLATIRRLAAAGLGGLSTAAGFLLPQYIAYTEYCQEPNMLELRPWCKKPFPSIYTFVQEYYWNVGLFRYWTLPNLPLFLLATPMSVVMILSGLWGIKRHGSDKLTSISGVPNVLRNMAVSQLLLTVITLTTAHVQIITRISSAYPVWMWYATWTMQKGNGLAPRSFVRFLVMYAIIQGGLFASFLPPA
ncbi:GPI mannosyltransferase 2 [Venustampulla echinocandica]|uniref:GPI mannosyltransferase 2 n=1 Tax=Venustampulla echinocandica TaxID=2656787 RepID=A0A370TVQ0_9HELO|nr:GPI mannosyltransferase 2 [Venustampulla echinocandica]RDL39606.1 GPI mannosyltransferase 2 [Venustampulla echinocandica]